MDVQKTRTDMSRVENKIFTEIDSNQFYLEEMQRMNNHLIDMQRELSRALKLEENAKKEKEQIFTAMSHDIRIPLNAIRGMTSMALDNLENTEFIRECLETIQNSSEYLISIINDILDIGRMESQAISPVEENFSISEEIEDIKRLMVPLFQEKEQTFICKLPDTCDYLFGSWTSIRRVIINLLSNASKYTQEKGEIILSIEVNSKEDFVCWMDLSVCDNGMGMSEEQLKCLFTPYFRTNRDEVKLIQGTGLGLTIVKRYVEACKGKIQVTSKEGEGSTFSISIPFKLGEKPECTCDSLNEMTKSHEPACYLLCEDNAVNIKIVRHLLEKKGYQMDAAKNGKEGIELFQKNPEKYRAIFMDMNMPVMGGLEAVKAIRILDPNILIIAMTGEESPEMFERAMAAGVNLHLQKPIDPKQFYEVIKRH